MGWSEVSLSVGRERAALVEEALNKLGALAVTLADDGDQPVLEPAPNCTPLWPVVKIRGLFCRTASRNEISLALMHLCGLKGPEALNWSDVAERDWQRAWMDRFRPMRFGNRLWIVPSGMTVPDDDRAVVVRLDPGLAFGTGTHPTTALCLQWIDGQQFTGRQVVDYGGGSGVLGIAAALKGAQRVVCVDNDPQALEATSANAVHNGVSERIICRAPRQFRGESADVVLANILAGPLIDLAPRLLRSLKSAGDIVLSGVLEEQAEAVAQAYRQKCRAMNVSVFDGWVRLHGIAA